MPIDERDIDLDFLDKWESILEHFETKDKWVALRRITIYLKTLNIGGLETTIHKLYGQWPHINIHTILIRGACRKVQANFYQEIYGQPPSQSIIDRNIEVQKSLCLSDLLPEQHIETSELKKSKKPIKPIVYKQVSPETQEKIKTLISEAIALGVNPDKLKRYEAAGSVGLAKMGIANLIKSLKKIQIKDARP
jgi:hypothetical protein